jgi:hypothetical protein
MIHRTKSQERLGRAYILYEKSYKMTSFMSRCIVSAALKLLEGSILMFFGFRTSKYVLCAIAARSVLTDSLCCEAACKLRDAARHADALMRANCGTQRAHGFAILRSLQASPCCEARGYAHAFKLRHLPGPCGCVVMPVKLQHIRRFTIAVIIAAPEGHLYLHIH